MAETKPKLTIEETGTDPSKAGRQDTDVPEDGSSEAGSGGAHRPLRAVSTWLRQNFPGHEHAAFGAACGLLVALLVFAIGLLRTLFVLLCVLVGAAIGQYLDGNPKMVKLVSKLFSDNRN